MNRKLISVLVGAILLSVAGAAIAVYAANGQGSVPCDTAPGDGPDTAFVHPGMIAPLMLHRLGDELDLTVTQRETIKGLLESARPNMKSMRAEMLASAARLRTTQPDDPNYASVVSEASQKAGELASRLVSDGSQLRAQIWEVLTPEQRTEFQKLQTRYQERIHERRLQHRPRAPKQQPANASVQDEIPTMTVTATRIRV
jgi:periplasmic protein CpxP/Spy